MITWLNRAGACMTIAGPPRRTSRIISAVLTRRLYRKNYSNQLLDFQNGQLYVYLKNPKVMVSPADVKKQPILSASDLYYQLCLEWCGHWL